MSDEREKLVRETFQLERDFNYWKFRQHHWNQAEILATLPVPQEREEVLRGFWNQDAEKRYPEYRSAVSGLSLAELEAEREQWLDRLSLLSPKQYQEILAEASSKTPANDNARGTGPEGVNLTVEGDELLDEQDAGARSKYIDLFKELRADYAAAKREDAHWYGTTTQPELPPALPENGYDKLLKQYADAGVQQMPPEKERGPER